MLTSVTVNVSFDIPTESGTECCRSEAEGHSDATGLMLQPKLAEFRDRKNERRELIGDRITGVRISILLDPCNGMLYHQGKKE